MPDLNDKELDTLLSALSPPEPPNHMSQRIMSALTAPQAAQNKGGIFASLFGARGIALPAGGALASLLFGLTIGYLALPDLSTETLSEEDQYQQAFTNSNWDDSFEDLLS